MPHNDPQHGHVLLHGRLRVIQCASRHRARQNVDDVAAGQIAGVCDVGGQLDQIPVRPVDGSVHLVPGVLRLKRPDIRHRVQKAAALGGAAQRQTGIIRQLVRVQHPRLDGPQLFDGLLPGLLAKPVLPGQHLLIAGHNVIDHGGELAFLLGGAEPRHIQFLRHTRQIGRNVPGHGLLQRRIRLLRQGVGGYRRQRILLIPRGLLP